MSNEKPDEVRWLEKMLQRPLHSLRWGKIMDWENRRCYELDSAGRVIGLNLHSCQLNDCSFLDNFAQLSSLHLGYNQINEWFFLNKLSRLATLNISRNRIQDLSRLYFSRSLKNLSISSNHIDNLNMLRRSADLVSLDVGDNLIRDVSFLDEMPQLVSLNLAGNHIHNLSYLKNLTNLKYLNISGIQICHGHALKGLTGLVGLDLGDNQIADGNFLARLTNLESLDLSNNRVYDWSFLSCLPQLKSLNLGDSGIIDGSFVKDLSQLSSLDLSANRILDWSFLDSLTQLTSLNLRDARIEFGTFLKGLTQLRILNLHNNRIRYCPFLKALRNLTWLDLSGNRISDGHHMEGLTQLTWLDLSGNRISDITFLKDLNNLRFLDISNNNIKEIIDNIYNLNIEIEFSYGSKSPDSINVAGNPLETPPLEIVAQGHAAILDWRRAYLEGERRLNEAKVILVGDGGVGKTSLRKRLMGLPADPREDQTHGVQINDFHMNCAGHKVLIHYWDFGGQEIMHATHQFFLSHRSLYILVLDGRKDEDADYWLKHIEAFGGGSRVLIVMTKVDQNPGFEVNRGDLLKKYRGDIRFYRVNCLSPDDSDLNRLIRELPGLLGEVEMVKSSWPARWLDVKLALEKDARPYLERREYAAMCEAAKVTDESQRQTLIRYLHDLGVALHFDDPRLKLLQVLKPRWATGAVYKMINAPRVADAHGMLNLDWLPEILAPTEAGDYDYHEDKHPYLVELMKKFELSYEVKPGWLLLPDLLDVQEPKFAFPTTDLLRFRYEYDFLPTSIIVRLMVKLHADIEGELRWRTGVVFRSKDSGARAVVRADKNARTIAIEVEGTRRRDYFAVIRHTLESIHGDFQRLEVKSKVPLPDNPKHAVDYKDLLFHEEKKRPTILVGELRKEYLVERLLEGVEPKEKRTRRRAGGPLLVAEKGDVYYHDYRSETNVDNSVKIVGDGNKENNLTGGVGNRSVDSLNRSENRANEIRELLGQLKTEVEKIAAARPDQAERATTSLDVMEEEAISDTPKKSTWSLSKQGIIDAATAVGVVGTTAIELVNKIGGLLGF